MPTDTSPHDKEPLLSKNASSVAHPSAFPTGEISAGETPSEALEDQADQTVISTSPPLGLQTAGIGFNPRELEKRLGKHSMFDQIVPGARKARYWEAYEDLYREIQREAEDDFQSLFGREFAEAYQAQMKKF